MGIWTLAQLKTRVRERADMVYSEFVSDAELAGYISNSYAKFYDMVTSAYVDDYVLDPFQFTISSGNSYTFTNTENFYKLVGVDFLDGSQWCEVRNFNFNQRNSTGQAYNMGRYHPVLRYKLMGSERLIFIPTDQATGTYRYWGIPKAAVLTTDTDQIDGYNGWEEYIVVDAAIKCLIKEESGIEEMVRERKILVDDIMAAAQNRDTGESERITDVYAGDLDYCRY